jgi:hypothetical protein
LLIGHLQKPKPGKKKKKKNKEKNPSCPNQKEQDLGWANLPACPRFVPLMLTVSSAGQTCYSLICQIEKEKKKKNKKKTICVIFILHLHSETRFNIIIFLKKKCCNK